MPRITGSVKSMMTSTEPPIGTFTVSSHWVGNRLIVFGVGQEMDLMYMHGMQFTSSIYDPPMLKRPHFCPHHRSVVRRELFAIDVEAVLVFRERHRESRRSFFGRRKVERFEFRFERTLCSLGQ